MVRQIFRVLASPRFVSGLRQLRGIVSPAMREPAPSHPGHDKARGSTAMSTTIGEAMPRRMVSVCSGGSDRLAPVAGKDLRQCFWLYALSRSSVAFCDRP